MVVNLLGQNECGLLVIGRVKFRCPLVQMYFLGLAVAVL